MMDMIFDVVVVGGLVSLWLGLGAVLLIVMDYHAERALSRINGRSSWGNRIAWILWPLTVLAVLALQFNPKYRGSNHDDIEYPDAFL